MTREEALEFIAQSVKSDVNMAKVADAIKALEQEPRKGHWIDMPIGFKCSECQELEHKTTKFCPNCGADMREVENDTD